MKNVTQTQPAVSTEPVALSAMPKTPITPATTTDQEIFEPNVDIYDQGGVLHLAADVPGATTESVETSVNDGVLTVRANVSPVGASWKPMYLEFSEGHFERRFRLPTELDAERITATLKNGVLTLGLPTAEKARPRKIQVKQG